MPKPLVVKKSDGFYSLPLFEKFGVRALFTTRKHDLAFEIETKPNIAGRSRVFEKFGISELDLVSPSQVHGGSVFVVTCKDKGKGALSRESAIQDTDALITNVPGLPLGILTADCLAVFILDPEKRSIGLVHAGWKGIKQEIILRTVNKMSNVYGSKAGNLVVALGPSIKSCCYEVGEEFKDAFPDSVIQRHQKFYFDIIDAALRQLKSCDITPGNIYDSRICTSCMSSEFFSYRKDKLNAGRSLSLMEISTGCDIMRQAKD